MKMEHSATNVLLAMAVCVGLVSSCQAAPAQVAEIPPATGSNEQAAVAEAVSSPAPQASSTPTPAPTATMTFTPLPFPTPTNTPTLEPTPTINPTATPEPDQLAAGIYNAGGCVDYLVSKRIPSGTLHAAFDFCVMLVEVNLDQTMSFVVSWTATYSPPILSVSKREDTYNRNMYIEDDLGYRYDFISTGGDAARAVNMESGTPYVGTFIFPPARPGATRFTFFDDDNHVEISGLLLLEPAVSHLEISLVHYPLGLDYYSNTWTASASESGGVMLTHADIPDCQIMEWPPSEIHGEYRNTLDIGPVTYELYRTLEENWSVREYLAIAVPGSPALTEQPLFHVRVPYENTEPCLEDVGAVLGSLH